MRLISTLKLLVPVATLVVASTVQAADDPTIEYRVVKGDTLYGLAKEYLVNDAAALRVQRLNAVREPRRLPVDRVLQIPRDLLRYEPVAVRVRSFSGPVTVSRDGRPVTPETGMSLAEGVEIATGRRGFVSLVAHDGSRVSLPSNSKVRLRWARRYLIDGSVDFGIEVLEGRSELTAPKLKPNERYRVGTPVAATAVRGTVFRVSFDPKTGQATTEVVEGTVDVSRGDADVSTGAGFGIAANEQGLGDLEALLPSPELVDGGKIQTDKFVNFSIAGLEEAAAYRTQLARDAGFVEVVSEDVGTETEISFEDIEDGRFYVRSRGIAESGIEGLSQAYSFRRKRVGVAATVEPGPYADAFKFAWLPEGEGQTYYAFQLWRAGQQDRPLFDEVGLDQKDILISKLGPGQYEWRVGAFQIDEGDVIKVWGAAETLNISE